MNRQMMDWRTRDQAMRRDMHFGYQWHNPHDVFKWSDELFAPCRLVSSSRHVQGFYLANFDLTWDGIVYTIHLKVSPRQYMHSLKTYVLPVNDAIRHAKLSAASDVMLSLVRSLGNDSLFYLAQKSIMQDVFWQYLHNYRSNDFSMRGFSSGDVSVNLSGKTITVQRGDEHDSFDVANVAASLWNNLKMKQVQLQLL